MATFQVRLLGPPAVLRDGTPLHVRTRKTLALLAYLTLEARPVARSSVAALLWPDSAPGVALSALRNTIAALRDMLGEDVGRLAVTRDTLTLAWLPADRLDLADLAAGDALAWRGELLEGLHLDSGPFEVWLGEQREAARARASRAFDHTSAALLPDDPERAAEVVTRWLSLDRLNEAAWRRLIGARLAARQPGPAREAFEACRAVLQGELGVAPAPETLALGARLRPGGDQPPPPPPRPGPGPELPQFLVGGPLIGRQREFGRLAGAYRLAAGGAPQAALLSGEPGIGKTRLAGELLAWARDRGATLLRGRAPETASQPYAALGEALRREQDTLRARLGPAHLEDLARLLPGLRDAPAPPAAGDLRALLLEALSAAVLALRPGGAGEAAVLLLDDLHWADASTLEAVLHLAARLAEAAAPLLLLFTARSEYLGTGTPLSGWLARLRRHLPLHEEPLGPLDVGGTRHLLGSALPRASGALMDRLTGWLFGETGGQPLYLTETLKGLIESGAVSAGAQGWEVDETRLPRGAEGVRAAIGERLSRLSPSALALAQGSAVLGRGETFRVLCGVAGLGEDVALAAYEELLWTGLLVELGGAGEPQAALSHDRVRETLLGALSGPRRQVLHRRALGVLQERHAPAATLAEHAVLGGLRMEAAALFEESAHAATGVGAHDEAVAALERALVLVPLRPEHQEQRLRLLLGVAVALFTRDAGLSPALLERTRQAAQGAGAAGAHGEQAAALNLLAANLVRAGRPGEAAPWARAAHAAARAAGAGRDEVWALLGLARAETALWNWDAARTHGGRALSLARSLGPAHEDLEIFAALGLAILKRWGRGALHEARAEIIALLPRARRFEQGLTAPLPFQDQLVPRLLWELLWQDLLVGAHDGARARLRELEGRGGRSREELLAMRALIALRRGDLAGALAASGAAVETSERLHLRFPNVYGIRALCLLRHGRLEEARQAVAVGQALNSAYNHVRDRANSALRFGEVLLALGEVEAAQREYGWVLGTFSLPHVLGALRGLGQVRARRGDGEGAALCCCAVLAHGAAGLDEEEQALATLADLRARFPADLIDAAQAEGAATPLARLVERVRAEYAGEAPGTGSG